MKTINEQLLDKIEELRAFCEEHGFPLQEFLSEELEYYREEFKK